MNILRKLWQWLFGCPHYNTTWPMGRVPYSICLDCGAQFRYDMAAMKRGERLARRCG